MADAVCHPSFQETHMTMASEFAADPALAGQIPPEASAPESAPRPSARTARMARDVYISYSHVDKAAADAACATLERAGIRCWIAPRDITPGDEWSASIIKAIDQCSAMVLIFSQNANNSRQIRREVERAITVGIPLVPVRIEDVVPTESLAYFMGTVHWLDAMTPPFENHLVKLADALKALLQARAPSPSAATAPFTAPGAGATAASSAAAAHAIPFSAATAEPSGKRRMFAEIMNFNYQRSAKQAFGWYLMYFLVGIVIALVSTYMASFFSNASDFNEGWSFGVTVGRFSAVPFNILLGILLIWHRKKDAVSLLLVLAGAILSSILGALGGLIPLAFLSNRPLEKPWA
jgi:TIR domain-containing protein